MRELKRVEKEQRGCCYCLNVKRVKRLHLPRHLCPYEKCPYQVLDKYETYEDFIESDDSKIEELMR